MTCAVNYNGASIRELTDSVMVHGEGPFWDSENNVLYFVDISERRVYRHFHDRLEHVQLGGYLRRRIYVPVLVWPATVDSPPGVFNFFVFFCS